MLSCNLRIIEFIPLIKISNNIIFEEKKNKNFMKSSTITNIMTTF